MDDCERCGAMLPDDHEGICPTCGAVYGKATAFMPKLTPDMIAAAEAEESSAAPPGPMTPANAPSPVAHAPAGAIPAAAPRSGNRLPIILILVFLGLALALGIGVILLLLP